MSPIPKNEDLDENVRLNEMEELDEMNDDEQIGEKNKKENNQLGENDIM